MDGPAEGAALQWEGGQWVLPGQVWLTTEVLLVGTAAAYVESTSLRSVSTALLEITFIVLLSAWFIGFVRLEYMSWSNHYAIIGSTLEVYQGIIDKAVISVSAGELSGLEVTFGPLGRVLDLGDISLKTQGKGSLELTRVRSPALVSEVIRHAMTPSLVRVEAQASASKT